MSVVDAVCLAVAVAALGGWSWFLVAHSRALLPQAQALQALAKLKDIEDEKIRKILSNFDEKRQAAPSVKDQIEEIKRKAEQFGFEVPRKPARAPAEPPVMPPPEPVGAWVGDFVE